MAGTAAAGKTVSQQAVRRVRKMPRGARIRWARQNAHFTLDGLAVKVGTSRQHLIRLEKGLHNPGPEMAARLAEATGVPVDLIRDEDDDEDSDPYQLMLRAIQMLQGRHVAHGDVAVTSRHQPNVEFSGDLR